MTTGKQLLLSALKNEKTTRPAWLPFVGVHGGHIIGLDAQNYLTSSDSLIQGLKKSIELYNLDGLPIVFDLQVEAEILGCELKWDKAVPPAVVTHPLVEKNLEDLPEITARSGRFPIITRVLDVMKKDHGTDVAFYGLICGPYTLALHLLGNDIFLAMLLEPDRVKKIVEYCAEVGKKAADIYMNHGADVIAVVDPMTSQISPEHFEEFVTPHVNAIFDHVRANNGLSSMFVCGDVSRNLEAMCATHADNVSVDEQISISTLRTLCKKHNKSFGGNIKLTAVLLLGDENDAKKEAINIIDDAGDQGFILAPGCDLPYDVPPANLQAVSAMIHDPYQRDIARQIVDKAVDKFDDVTLQNYSASDGVVLDVITLDSTSCAPCQYMMEAVEKAAAASGIKVYVNEHKIKVRQGIGMMCKLGVKNLPTICINGEVKFASIIPDLKTLIGAITEAHNQMRTM